MDVYYIYRLYTGLYAKHWPNFKIKRRIRGSRNTIHTELCGEVEVLSYSDDIRQSGGPVTRWS